MRPDAAPASRNLREDQDTFGAYNNPSEYLDNDLKQQLRRQPQPGSERELVERTRSVLRTN
jgi:hypothetical protein